MNEFRDMENVYYQSGWCRMRMLPRVQRRKLMKKKAQQRPQDPVAQKTHQRAAVEDVDAEEEAAVLRVRSRNHIMLVFSLT